MTMIRWHKDRGRIGSFRLEVAVLLSQMETMSATSQPVIEMPPCGSMERHFSVAQIADRWALSEDTVRRLFENESGVLVIEPPRGRYSRRRYRTLRIPESVVERVHKTHLVVTGRR
jgi:hypothetical protein